MTQTAKLTSSDSAYDKHFGCAVSISGNTVVVGAELAKAGYEFQQGAAFVFTQTVSGWANMTETATLTSSDSGGYDNDFGDSVSISGSTIVVGADGATVGANLDQGAAYVFTEPGTAWATMTQTAKLTASDGVAGDAFGYSVMINGNTIVVGCTSLQGAAYVFAEPGAAWATMTQTAKLTASDAAAGEGFGNAVLISGDTIVVGAYFATVGGNSYQGAAYVFNNVPAPTVTGISPAAGSAAGGTTVTITGTGFSGATAVDFGSFAATNVAINSAGTQITATSPAGPTGAVDVTVTTAGGVSATSSADKFTYLANSLGVYSGGYWYFTVNGTTQIVASPAGWSGATPVVGDWNGAPSGSGKTEIGLFLNGNWWLDTNGNGTLDSGDAQFSFGFGGSDVVPVVGDWNGGGKTEVGVYANGAWFRDYDNSHTWDAVNQSYLAYLGWNDNGTHTVIPVPGNWAGDGKTEMGVYCQGVWFLDSTDSNKWDGGHTYWGWSGSLIPVVGNWSGSGAKSQFGVYNQGAWFLDYDNTHTWDAANQDALTYYGWAGALPLVAGSWNV